MNALKLIPILLLFVLSTILVAAAPSLINDLGVNVTVDGIETTLAGNLTDGFKLELNHTPATSYYLQFNSNTISNEPLNETMFGLYLTSSSTTQAELEEYYKDTPQPYKDYLINASKGLEPFAYINGTNSQLVDAALFEINGLQVDMRIPGDYPTGEYTLVGSLQNNTGSFASATFKLLINLDKTLDLVQGWNQVSSPYSETVSVTELQTQCPGIRIVKGFTVSSESFDDVTSLEPGKGYRIYSDNACSITFDHTFNAYEAFDKTLSTGTHLIGAPYEGMTAMFLHEKCNIKGNVLGWDANGNTDAVAQLEAGKGYFVILNAPCDVTQTENVNISIDSYNPISVIQGKTERTNFTLRNLGNRHVDPITIVVSDFMSTNGDILDNSNIMLDGTTTQTLTTAIRIAENETIGMRYQPPLGKKAGTYTGFVTITYAGKTLVQELSVTIVAVNEQVSASYDTVSMLQGTSKEFNVTVTNNGNVDLTNIGVAMNNMYNGVNVMQPTLGTTSINLAVGGSENISITLNPAADLATGIYEGNLSFTINNEAFNTTISATVLETIESVSANYASVNVIQEDKVNTTLTLTNDGNVNLPEVNVSFTSLRLNSTEEILPVLNTTQIAPLNLTETAIVGIEYDTAGRAAGTYTGNVTLTYDNVTDIIPVTLTVTARNENVNVAYNEVSLTQGNNATTSFTVSNIGNVPITANYVVSNLVNANGDLIIPIVNSTSAALNIGASSQVQINYTTTRTQSGTYNGNITTTYDGEEIITPIRLVVNEIQGSVTIASPSVSGLQGSNVNTNFTITNNGDKELTIDLELNNLTKGTEQITSPIVNDINLAIGASSKTDLTFAIPSTVSAGTYTGNLLATFQGQTITQPVTIVVIARAETISYPTSTSLRWLNGLNQGVGAQAIIQNTGNVNLDVSLAMSNLVGNGIISSDKVSLSDATFTLTPGESKNVVLTPTGITALGGTYTGSVNIVFDGQTAQMPVILTVKDPEYSISASDVTFDGNIRGKNDSTALTITNNGDYNLGLITITNTINSKYNATITPTALSGLAIGASQNIEVSIDVPEDESTQNHKIGEIHITELNYNKTLNVYLNPDAAIRIDELEIRVDGDKDEVNDGDTISDEAKPGSEIKFEFKIENLLENSELRDVLIEIEIRDIDEGDDLDLESDETDIDEEDDERIELEFTIPMLVEDKEYDVDIHVEGEDEDGNMHEIDWVVKLQVEKEKHEIMLDRVIMSPTRVSCSRSSTLEIKAINIGEQDEDDVEVIVKNAELDFEARKTFDLDSGDDDDAERTTAFTIRTPELDKTKTYTFSVDVYRDGRRDDSDTVSLTVEKCDIVGEEPDADDSDEGPFVVEGNANIVAPPAPEESSTLDDLRESDLYLPALGVIVLAAGVAIFAIIPK
ncbi:hypothetical protein HN592_04055 [Candidatus Woesearchaeota archaeon]|nr:hypothetical protein [Candidatus Woesearchaeota archaeon]MBT4368385.1 hypothetical protein [Candidatus Woesearchaeota archaeon]MBT4712874.1 hypothetical protein [Candidatus Woesearchaeota archaeon]MBT6639786.1 hypothetical protein [Candidatus Woesearchaeota archaeon]MBT7133958.1 hypothetical protein [Candidatus Woesearchaeota archaeon]